MRPKKHEKTGSGDLFRARLEQIINMKHELVLLADKIEWQWIDSEIAPLYSDKGRPGIETRFVIGLLLLKHTYGLSDEGVCERWVHDPYFQHFTGEEFFQHEFPHERSDLSHWRKRLGNKLELLLAESLGAIKRELRRRSANEAVIGHMKNDGHLGRCYLKGRDGDAANAILTAVGYNFRLLLGWLRALLRLILIVIRRSVPIQSALRAAC
jgi:hypothetical protein